MIGEGANLAVTQAGRIEFAEQGGRINTDFIDNSAGVDCSDNEVNIKIPLNREMLDGRLTFEQAQRAACQDDRRCRRHRARGQSAAEPRAVDRRSGRRRRRCRATFAPSRSSRVRAASTARSKGSTSSEEMLRRAQENRGLTRPELAVVLSISKIVLQDAAESFSFPRNRCSSPSCSPLSPSRWSRRTPTRSASTGCARDLATKVANRFVNRLGPGVAFDLTEEEGASLQQVIAAFLVAERLLDLDKLWAQIETAAARNRAGRAFLDRVAFGRARTCPTSCAQPAAKPASAPFASCSSRACARFRPPRPSCIRSEVRNEAAARRERLIALGASEDIVRGLVRLFELDGVFGIAALAARRKIEELAVTRAYTRLGEALGLDWAQQQIARFAPADQWERLLTAGLARDFEQLRIEFLSRMPRRIRTKRSMRGLKRSRPGSTSSARSSPAPAPRVTSARRCSPRSPARRESCSRDSIAHRHAGPRSGLSGALGLGVRCRGRRAAVARREGRSRCRGPIGDFVRVRPRPAARRLGISPRLCALAGVARSAEAERWPMFNPVPLLRWNGDKAYLVELGDAGVATVPTLAVEACALPTSTRHGDASITTGW